MSEVITYKTKKTGRVVTFKRPGPFTKTLALRNIPAFTQSPSRRGKRPLKSDKQADVVEERLVLDDLNDHVFLAEQFCICSIKPKYTTAIPAPFGSRHLDELGDELNEVLGEFAKHDTGNQEVEEIDPLSETSPPSSGSTSPDEPGDAGPLVSSRES